MNLRSLDLNLLVIFDALMTERSITRAASRIGMTPSALSHALRRLRDTFQDPLIERTPDGMVPTRRALDLQQRVHEALADIARAVDQQLVFDPATSERTFKIRTTDYLMCCLLPRVCTRVRAEAPKATLFVEFIGDDGDMREEPGDLVLRLYADAPDAEHAQHRLLQDRLVVAMRRDHPAASEPMSLDLFVSVPQVRVSTAALGANLVDDRLAKRGLKRRVVSMIPTLAAVMPDYRTHRLMGRPAAAVGRIVRKSEKNHLCAASAAGDRVHDRPRVAAKRRTRWRPPLVARDYPA